MGIPVQPEQEPDPIGDAQDRLIAELAAQPKQEPVACLSKTQAKAILGLALDLEKTGRMVVITQGQERTDFVARNRNIQCALEDALHNATTPPAAPMTEFEEAVAAVDKTLHHAIDHWQDRALKAEALLAKSKQEPVAEVVWGAKTGFEWKFKMLVELACVEDVPVKLYAGPFSGAALYWHDTETDKAATPPAAQRKPQYNKTEMNCFVQNLYDEKLREGKHGHYETMFHVVHRAIEAAHGIKE
jgi:hypothetical protein